MKTGAVLVAGFMAMLGSAGIRAAANGSGLAIELLPAERDRILRCSPLPPVPPDTTNAWARDPAAANLGQILFSDTRLSGSGRLSCASCHDPARGFSDGQPLASAGAAPGSRRTLSLWNVAYGRWFFWDGRSDSLWAQALQPLLGAAELGGSRERTARVIRDDPALREPWERLFGPLPDAETADGPALDRVAVDAAKAIASYEQRLVSRRAPFDAFVEGLRSGSEGDERLGALSAAAQRGMKLFFGRADCRRCHLGPLFTDGEFHSIGLAPRGGGPALDAGRYRGAALVLADPFNASGAFSDDRNGERARQLRFLPAPSTTETWGQFKTPSLREVARRAPYMHQGQMATLADVVRYYSTLEGAAPAGHHQEQVLKPLRLADAEMADLVAFLESLSSEALDPAPRLPH